MPIDIVEMFWECSTCKSTNRGRNKDCSHCGKPKNDSCKEWLPDDVDHDSANVIDHGELFHKFTAGPDWKCKYCGCLEWKVDGSCAQCGASQDEKKEFESIKNDAKNIDSEKKKTVKSKKTVVAESSNDHNVPYLCYVKKNSYKPKAKIAGGFALFATAAGTLMYVLLHKEIHHAVVTSTHWDSIVHVDRNQVVHHSGFYPADDAFNVVSDGPRVHHYDHVIDHYESVSYTYSEVCGQPSCTTISGSCTTAPRSCRSNKNGSATCSGGDRVCSSPTRVCTPKICNKTGTRREAVYRDDPMTQMYYDWDRHGWVRNRDVSESGDDTHIKWPSSDKLSIRADERTSGQDLKLKTVFMDDDDHETHEYAPESMSEFESSSVGTKRTISVGIAGNTVVEKTP